VSRLVGEQLQKQLDFMEQSSAASGIDYKFTTVFEVLDGGNGSLVPSTLETFEMYGCFIQNADYGDAFAKYGVIGVLMRIEDKLQRSVSITKNGVNLIKDEGIRDTLIDLHNYAAMALMLIDE
jgi:hypothetical protein